MRFKLFGYRGKINSVDRIEQELVKNGWVIDNDNPEFLIDLTGPFHDAEIFYKTCSIKPKKLYCLLDIDIQKSKHWYEKIITDLQNCEIPCVISNVVASQLNTLFDFKGKINILRHPLRPITHLRLVKGLPFLWSGRCFGWNKKFELAIETLKVLRFPVENLVIAGTENPQVGAFFIDTPDDENLNTIFNSSKFLLSPSIFEGQNCNMLQAIISHTYPILNNQCDVVKEFGLEKFSADPSPFDMARKINEIEINPSYYNSILNELRPDIITKFSVERIAKDIIDLCLNKC